MNHNMKNSQVQSARSDRRKAAWRTWLELRGISEDTSRAAKIKGHEKTGWQYPIFNPDTGKTVAKRFKSFPDFVLEGIDKGKDVPKYRWIKGKPDGVDWYTLATDGLSEAVAVARGVLWIANGEPDVWALHSAGRPNAACTLLGEGNLPATFTEDVLSWDVREIRMAPDLDDKGTMHAAKIAAALKDTTISVVVYELPTDLGDAGDIGKAWIEHNDYGEGDFESSLRSLPVIDVEELAQDTASKQGSDENVHFELPDDFIADIEYGLGVNHFSPDGWSEAFPCPLKHHEKDSKQPAAHWHRDKHILKCFKCHGEHDHALAKEVGEVLGIDLHDYLPSSRRSSHNGSGANSKAIQTSAAGEPMATMDDLGDMLLDWWDGELAFFRAAFYSYEQGVWLPYHFLGEDIYKLLKKHKRHGVKPTKTLKIAVEDYLKERTRILDEDIDQGEQHLNLENGLLNLESLDFEDHQIELYMTSQLSFPYDPDAECPMWHQFLDETLLTEDCQSTDKDLKALVQEAFGYSLTADTSLEKAFILLGEAATGKSTVLRVLQILMGNAHTALNLGTMARDRYQLANIPGKRVVTCSEISSLSVLADADFKQLVSGEEMVVRPIYGKPFSMTPQAKIWWGMNELPQINDRSRAVYRRLVIIPFHHVVPDNEQNPKLVSHFEAELPGILNWAVDGLKRLQHNGAFTKVTQVDKLLCEYQEENQVEAAFVAEHIEADPGNKIPASKLYAFYKKWCEESGFEPMHIKRVGREWSKLGLEKVRLGRGYAYLIRIIR